MIRTGARRRGRLPPQSFLRMDERFKAWLLDDDAAIAIHRLASLAASSSSGLSAAASARSRERRFRQERGHRPLPG